MSEKKRGQGATKCYGCLCDTCANSVELSPWYTTAGECREPCFSCDDCRHYDGDHRKKDRWRVACPWYIEAQRVREARERRERAKRQREEQRAGRLRSMFKIIKGGKRHE